METIKSLRGMLTDYMGGDSKGRCTCEGCDDCKGHIDDCLCDVDWMQIYELRRIWKIRSRALALHNRNGE